MIVVLKKYLCLKVLKMLSRMSLDVCIVLCCYFLKASPRVVFDHLGVAFDSLESLLSLQTMILANH